MKTIEERFWSKVKKGKDDECWEWIGAIIQRGYGEMVFNKKIIGAHRISYELHKGEIPDEMFILHSCDNRKCVNPNHLRIGTQKENMKEASQKGRMYIPFPKGTKITKPYKQPKK